MAKKGFLLRYEHLVEFDKRILPGKVISNLIILQLNYVTEMRQ